MIILITGVPGSGKTSSLVHMLMTDKTLTEYTDNDGQTKPRIIYVNGIDELKINHQLLTDEQIKEKPFQDYLPYASLVVIDEAQRLFSTRSASTKIPPYIEALALHRHHGLDIVLLTQHPSFLDVFVRRLVQRHIHISIKSVGRKIYEWNECVDNPDNPAQIIRATERTFVLPKKAFDQYKSAEVHTKPKRRLPTVFYFFGFLIIVLIVLGWFVYKRMSERFDLDNSSQISNQETTYQSSNTLSKEEATTYKTTANNNSLNFEMFIPRIPERPESKPIYDSIRQVKTFEYPVACVKSEENCHCYTEQATLIKEITDVFCEDYIEYGHFNPYLDESHQIQQTYQEEQTQ